MGRADVGVRGAGGAQHGGIARVDSLSRAVMFSGAIAIVVVAYQWLYASTLRVGLPAVIEMLGLAVFWVTIMSFPFYALALVVSSTSRRQVLRVSILPLCAMLATALLSPLGWQLPLTYRLVTGGLYAIVGTVLAVLLAILWLWVSRSRSSDVP